MTVWHVLGAHCRVLHQTKPLTDVEMAAVIFKHYKHTIGTQSVLLDLGLLLKRMARSFMLSCNYRKLAIGGHSETIDCYYWLLRLHNFLLGIIGKG